MSGILFKNARVFDGVHEDCQEGMQVLVEGDLIREVSATPIKSTDAQVIDAAGNLSMTTEDFASFVQLHLRGLTGDSAGPDSAEFKYMDTAFSGFSLGAWNGTRVCKPYVCLEGTAGTFYARGVVLPESDFAVTVMMNCGSEKAVDYITMALLKAHFNWWWMFWN
jgi:CubicO group peptidase (beta-lactamase class C family)